MNLIEALKTGKKIRLVEEFNQGSLCRNWRFINKFTWPDDTKAREALAEINEKEQNNGH